MGCRSTFCQFKWNYADHRVFLSRISKKLLNNIVLTYAYSYAKVTSICYPAVLCSLSYYIALQWLEWGLHSMLIFCAGYWHRSWPAISHPLYKACWGQGQQLVSGWVMLHAVTCGCVVFLTLCPFRINLFAWNSLSFAQPPIVHMWCYSCRYHTSCRLYFLSFPFVQIFSDFRSVYSTYFISVYTLNRPKAFCESLVIPFIEQLCSAEFYI